MGAEKGELADMLHPQSPTHYHAGRRAAVSVTQIQTEGSDSLSHKRGPNGENQPLCRTETRMTARGQHQGLRPKSLRQASTGSTNRLLEASPQDSLQGSKVVRKMESGRNYLLYKIARNFRK